MPTTSQQIKQFDDEVAKLPYTSAQKIRMSLPDEVFEIRWHKFLLKFVVANSIIAAMGLLIIGTTSPVRFLAIPILGLMFAHLVELQHECLHEHAFKSRKLNRTFGFLCGVFYVQLLLALQVRPSATSRIFRHRQKLRTL